MAKPAVGRIERVLAHTSFCLKELRRTGRPGALSGDLAMIWRRHLGPAERCLTRFAGERGVEVRFNILGLTVEQVEEWNLPTRPHKRATVADQRWPHPYACELDAIPPHDLRALVKGAIEQHLPADELARLLNIEDQERETMRQFLSTWDVTS